MGNLLGETDDKEASAIFGHKLSQGRLGLTQSVRLSAMFLGCWPRLNDFRHEGKAPSAALIPFRELRFSR
jgi:hypothetical protein